MLGRRLAQWVAVLIDGRKEIHPVLLRQTEEAK
jgi:hypothetical protein